MIAAAIHIVAIALVLGVGVWLEVSDWLRTPKIHMIALVAGIIGGVAVVVSGFYVMESWAALMEHFDFTDLMRENVSPKRLPSSFYFLPASMTALGAAAAFVFGLRLYRVVWEEGYFKRR